MTMVVQQFRQLQLIITFSHENLSFLLMVWVRAPHYGGCQRWRNLFAEALKGHVELTKPSTRCRYVFSS